MFVCCVVDFPVDSPTDRQRQIETMLHTHTDQPESLFGGMSHWQSG